MLSAKFLPTDGRSIHTPTATDWNGLLLKAFRRRTSNGGRRRILFVTDLHSSEITFRKVLNAVGVYEADILIVGGDLCGKQLVPVVVAGDAWRARVLGEDCAAGDDVERDALLARIRDLGQYPMIIDEAVWEATPPDPEEVERRFVEACHEQVRAWMARLAERFGESTPVYVTGGNDDFLSIEPILEDAPWVVNAEGKALELLPGMTMISTGYGNPTPWSCPRDISEDELSERIEEMAHRIDAPSQALFNLHVPPVASGLDTCMRLDVSVTPPKPITGEETSAGSTAVRAAIERYQPVVSLHGHIHESRGIRHIGGTTCINPGSEYAEGVLRGAVVDIVGTDLQNAQLVSA